MYQPRRAGDSAGQQPAVDSSTTVDPAPRRFARTWYRSATDRVGAMFLGLAVVGTAGALARAGTASAAPSALPVTTPDPAAREVALSREAPRPQIAAEDSLAVAAATKTPKDIVLNPTRTMYAKKKVAVVAKPAGGAATVTTAKTGAKLTVTPETSGAFRKVLVKDRAAWVPNASLVAKKPTPKQVADADAPKASRKVPKGSVLGLRPEAMVVYRAVMSRWAVKNVGGWRAQSLSVHQYGRAIDFMTYSNTSQGNAIAKFLVAHAKEFGVDHIIYRQKIWTPYKPVWRHMANRGSATANHMDHVHVAVDQR